MPESGTINPTLTSAGCCARTTVGNPMAAALAITVLRVIEVLDVLSWLISGSPILFVDRFTYRDRPCGRDRLRAGFDCCLEVQRGRLRERNHDRQIQGLPRRVARRAGSSGRTAAEFQSAVRK